MRGAALGGCALLAFSLTTAASSLPPDFPKNIYTFWDGPLTSLAQMCVETWHRWAPDWTIHILNRTAVFQLLPGVTEDGSGLCGGWKELLPTQLSDLLRLEILSVYPGVWLDITVAMVRPFDLLVSQLVNGTALGGLSIDYVGQTERCVSPYNEGWSNHFHANGSLLSRPLNSSGALYFESWFYAAPQGCKLVKQWRDQFRTAVSWPGGLAGWSKDLLQEPRSQVYLHPNLTIGLPYLSIYAALAKARFEQPHSPVLSLRSEAIGYAHLDYALDWNIVSIQMTESYELDFYGGPMFALGRGASEVPPPPAVGPLLKIRSLDRKAVDRIFFYAAYAQDSPLVEVFNLEPPPWWWPSRTMRYLAAYDTRHMGAPNLVVACVLTALRGAALVLLLLKECPDLSSRWLFLGISVAALATVVGLGAPMLKRRLKRA